VSFRVVESTSESNEIQVPFQSVCPPEKASTLPSGDQSKPRAEGLKGPLYNLCSLPPKAGTT
jgi:hypothetical protein